MQKNHFFIRNDLRIVLEDCPNAIYCRCEHNDVSYSENRWEHKKHKGLLPTIIVKLVNLGRYN